MGKTALKCSLVMTWRCTHEHVVQQLWLPAHMNMLCSSCGYLHNTCTILSQLSELWTLSSQSGGVLQDPKGPASPWNPSEAPKLTSLELLRQTLPSWSCLPPSLQR